MVNLTSHRGTSSINNSSESHTRSSIAKSDLENAENATADALNDGSDHPGAQDRTGQNKGQDGHGPTAQVERSRRLRWRRRVPGGAFDSMFKGCNNVFVGEGAKFYVDGVELDTSGPSNLKISGHESDESDGEGKGERTSNDGGEQSPTFDTSWLKEFQEIHPSASSIIEQTPATQAQGSSMNSTHVVTSSNSTFFDNSAFGNLFQGFPNGPGNSGGVGVTPQGMNKRNGPWRRDSQQYQGRPGPAPHTGDAEPEHIDIPEGFPLFGNRDNIIAIHGGYYTSSGRGTETVVDGDITYEDGRRVIYITKREQ